MRCGVLAYWFLIIIIPNVASYVLIRPCAFFDLWKLVFGVWSFQLLEEGEGKVLCTLPRQGVE